MAALVCDICGGKLVMGSGGIAVCESCGMEHSQERVKEKVQEIKGTVRVDNSHMVDSWMQMGLQAAAAGNESEAYEYFTKVIEIEPRNWRAIYEKGKAAAWQSNLLNSRVPELYQAVINAIKIAIEDGIDTEELVSFKNECAIAIFNVNNAFWELRKKNFSEIKDKYEDIHYDQWWDVYYTYSKANIEQTEDVLSLISDLDDDLSKSNIIEMKKHICDVLEFMCSTETFWDSYEQHYLQKYALSLSTKGELTKKYEALVDEIRIKEPN